MFKIMDSDELVKGEIYCVMNIYLKKKENLIFDTRAFFAYPNNNYYFQIHFKSNIIYKYVSKEEYYGKLKEKYDSKCLDIVLKRLINETFSW